MENKFEEIFVSKNLEYYKPLLSRFKKDELFKIVLIDFLIICKKARYFIIEEDILFNELSRDYYFKKIRIRSKILSIIGFDKELYISLHQHFLLLMRYYGYIDKIPIRKTKIVDKKKEYTTVINIKFFCFSKGELYSPMNFINFNENTPNIITNEDIFISNFWRGDNIYIRKKEMITNNYLTLKTYKKLINNKLKMNFEFIECNKKLINDKLNELGGTLFFKKLLNKNKEDMNKEEKEIILKNFKIINNSIFLLDLLDEKDKWINKIIYLSWKIDNRFRIYNSNNYSITFNTELRMLYNFNIIENNINAWKEKIDKCKLKNYLPKSKNIYKSFYENIIFKTIGVFAKNKIEKIDNYFISMEQFIEKGKSLYKERILSFEYHENLYVNYLSYKLDKFYEKGDIDLNLIIYVDATASGLQNLSFFLICKEEEKKYLNLDGDKWCDTYLYISKIVLSDIFEKLKLNSDKWNFLINRKILKKLIMTKQYNVSWQQGKKYFIEGILENSHWNENDLTTNKIILEEIYTLLFKKLNSSELSFFLKKKINQNINKIDVKYGYLDRTVYKKQFKNKRDKYTKIEKLINIKYNEYEILPRYDKNGKELKNLKELKYKSNNDYKTIKVEKKDYEVLENGDLKLYRHKKTNSAYEANIVQNMDSEVMWKGIDKFLLLPIHDSMGVRIYDLLEYIDFINTVYGNNYSPFIQI